MNRSPTPARSGSCRRARSCGSESPSLKPFLRCCYRAVRRVVAGIVSASASDLASRRWLCPVRNSAQSYAPPGVPPATGAVRSSTGRYAPDGIATGLLPTVPAAAPARRGDKHRVRFPARNGIPRELWNLTFAEENAWRERFAAVPYEDKGGSHPGRYYQDIAIERVLDAIANGQNRILLTLATGTGKTFIAFQIAWKLFHSRWNRSGQPTRRPRILFLADRNILADQAYNAFSALPEDALVRIAPEDIRKKGKVPKNGSVFFTIFQTFMSGPPKDGNPSPYFGEYPPDFFDFIVIDECHRGGANDESNWRGIMEYFAPAAQLGLTATPKRNENADTYRYFGEPVYIYSLKDGINDGFLTPFKVRQIQATLADYVYTPGRCPQHPQHRAHAAYKFDDRVQADHRAGHTSLRWEGLLHDL